ncbi:hypothetical protein HPB47_021319 [Ixodes persulcatus]|uniref:Uncharacterized protein n=1 Tax=Ixodes persulcatus TaxID=34615 RepID=A0AC60QD19_IXOPE|nr:hypothetical protein HPB47_021319 [Ixodes persulcatus]
MFSTHNAGCDPMKVASCTGDIRKMSSHPMDDLEVAEDVAGLEQKCREMEKAKQCLRRETSQCSEDIRSIYLTYLRPVTASFQDLCRPGDTRDEYLKHAPCFGRMSRRDGPCSAKYEKLRNLMTSDMDLSRQDNNTLSQFCWRAVDACRLKNTNCYFYAFYNCYRTDTEEQCGPEAYRIFERYTGYLSGSLFTSSCEKQMNNTECEPIMYGSRAEDTGGAARAGGAVRADGAQRATEAAPASALSVLVLAYLPPYLTRRLTAAV